MTVWFFRPKFFFAAFLANSVMPGPSAGWGPGSLLGTSLRGLLCDEAQPIVQPAICGQALQQIFSRVLQKCSNGLESVRGRSCPPLENAPLHSMAHAVALKPASAQMKQHNTIMPNIVQILAGPRQSAASRSRASCADTRTHEFGGRSVHHRSFSMEKNNIPKTGLLCTAAQGTGWVGSRLRTFADLRGEASKSTGITRVKRNESNLQNSHSVNGLQGQGYPGRAQATHAPRRALQRKNIQEAYSKQYLSAHIGHL